MRKIAFNVLLWSLVLAPCAMAQLVPVGNVEEFYKAVNDAANAGARVVLARGTYRLTPTDPNGASRPHGGRIEMQPDMSLTGLEGDRDAVVIDAFDLPASSFPAPPNAAIRMGLGHNALQWLTVRDARFAQANIDSGLQPVDAAPAWVEIAHVASTGGVRGLNVLNAGTQAAGQTLEADIIDSYFFDNRRGIAEGLRIGNFQKANGSLVNARMSGNRAWGQETGRLIVNNGVSDSTVNVISEGNQFYGNGAGTIVIGALTATDRRIDGNTIHFEARGDRFLRNDAETHFDHGGLVVLGAENPVVSSRGGSNNEVHIELWGCRMRENDSSDLTAIAARSVSESTATLSQNNHIVIDIHGDGDGDGDGNGKWQRVQLFVDQVPADPNYGNTVTVRH